MDHAERSGRRLLAGVIALAIAIGLWWIVAPRPGVAPPDWAAESDEDVAARTSLATVWDETPESLKRACLETDSAATWSALATCVADRSAATDPDGARLALFRSSNGDAEGGEGSGAMVARAAELEARLARSQIRADAIAAERDAMRAERDAEAARAARLQQERDAVGEETAGLKASLAEAMRTREAAVDDAASLMEELRAARRTQIVLGEQLEEARALAGSSADDGPLGASAEALEAELSALQAELSALQSELAAHRADAAAAQTALDRTEAQRDAAQRREARLLEQRNALRADLALLQQNSSPSDPSVERLEGEIRLLRAALRAERNALASAAALGCQRTMNAVAASGAIRFRSGVAEFVPAANPALEQLIIAAAQCPEGKITVEGHTDNSGTDALNDALAQARADAVASYLVNGGVEAGRVTARGFGASRPVADNATIAGRALNRRIEFVVE